MEIAGKPVRNAKKPVVLVITSDDVKKGATRDPASCAAALACKRQMNASEARVHTGRTYVRIKDEWIRFNTPVSLQKEIVAFDRGGVFRAWRIRIATASGFAYQAPGKAAGVGRAPLKCRAIEKIQKGKVRWFGAQTSQSPHYNRRPRSWGE